MMTISLIMIITITFRDYVDCSRRCWPVSALCSKSSQTQVLLKWKKMNLCNYEDIGDGVNAALRYSQDLDVGRAIKIVFNILNILLWCILCWHVNCMLSKINGSLLFMPKIWHHNTERSFTSVRLIKIKHSLAELDSENHSRWKHFWKSMNKTENTISYFADLGKHFGTDFKFMWKNIFLSTSSSHKEERKLHQY